MKQIIWSLLIVLMVTGCIPPSERKANCEPNCKPDDQTLYNYAFSQFRAHIVEMHHCKEVKLIGQKIIVQDDMVVSEKWTAKHCGIITEHIVIRAFDNYGEMIVGVGDLDKDNKETK